MKPLVNIYLEGALGQQFRPHWRLAVSSPAEALRAINVNTKGKLYQYLVRDGKHAYYQISLQNRESLIGEDEVTHKSGECDIYVSPVIKGANSGVGKIIAGVVIIAAAIFLDVVTFGGASSLTPAEAALVGTLFGVGASLVLGGVSQLIAANRRNPNDGQLNSNSFQGTATAATQGGCVPVVYGKALVRPMPVSIWFYAVSYDTTANQYIGFVTPTPVAGGALQWVAGGNGVPVTTPSS